MHPIFGRLATLSVYLALWLAVGAGAALGLSLRAGWTPEAALLTALPLCLAYGVVCLAAWYVCRAFPLGGAGSVGRVLLAHAAAALLTSALWVSLARWWARLVGDGMAWSRDLTLLLSLAALLLFLLSSALHYVYLALEAQAAARRQALEAAVLAREAELRALRAQVNPHFLFNSLHSIAALASTRPSAARDMAIGLGEFLRYSVKLGGLDVVPLQQEVALMTQYLAIEQVRFGERLRVHIHVADGAGTVPVPPLVLQPIVENAIKHGVAGLIDGGDLRLEARRDGDACIVGVTNAFDAEAVSARGTGTGLRNVRERLAVHYGSAASVDARVRGDRFEVTLHLPCGRPGEAKEA